MSSVSTRRVLRMLVDTNVILDVALDRAPWASAAVLLFDAIGRGNARGFVAAHAVSTVHYLVEKQSGRVIANSALSDLLELLTVVALDGNDFRRALGMHLPDFDDAVQVAACLKCDADFLVTRNAKDFKGSPAKIASPGEVVSVLAQG